MNIRLSKIAKYFYGRKLFSVENAVSLIIYGIFVICVTINLYILLNRSDTIYYLRIYHLVSLFLLKYLISISLFFNISR